MTAAVKIIDWQMGRSQVERPHLKLVSKTITAGELIAERVRAEHDALVAEQETPASADTGSFLTWLVRPGNTETRLNGDRVYGPGTLDDSKGYIGIARAAFEAGQFIMLFDGVQTDSWRQRLLVTARSTATFISLVPLKGG